ncbi:hypothetical protein DM80_6166 [Burkholderia multivorans]|nr:hypothetical protein DM80_6166 [Burkholderia multivorans]
MSVNTFLTNKMKYSYRCIVPIKSSNVDAWLAPDPIRRAQLLEILVDRERPHYEHRLAA